MGSYETAGFSTRPGHYLKQWISDAGFKDIRTHHFRVPVGVWSKGRHLVGVLPSPQIIVNQ